MAVDPLHRPLTPKEKLGVARQVVIEEVPYFTSCVLGMIPREAPGLGTFGVTKRAILLWDPEMADKWTVKEIAAVLVHEVGHLLRDHEGRGTMGGYDHRLFNWAGDLEINDDLVKAKWTLPGGALQPSDMNTGKHGYIVPSTFGLKDGMTAEYYYTELRKQARAAQKMAAKAGGQQGDEGEGGNGDKPTAGGGWCGSAAGREVPGEPQGDKGPQSGRGPGDLERMRHETAEAIKEAAQKSRGSIPGGWLRWAEEQLKPSKIPWQTKLARACRRALTYKAGAVDYTYAKPSRRIWGMGVGPGKPLLPSMRAPIPNVAVVVDTSGSMGADELMRGVTEIRAILLATGSPIQFIACDADVHVSNQAVNDWRQLRTLLKGGGGTDFRPAFDNAEKLKVRPDVLVFVTDGMGPAPDVAPVGFHTIWLLVGKNATSPCKWGAQIFIDD